MGAARASTAGHLSPAFNAMSEAQTAYATGHGTSGFLFFARSLGASPLPFSSLFFVSLRSNHTPFTHPVGVVLHNMFITAAASLSTT
jgi:hypothetical protein